MKLRSTLLFAAASLSVAALAPVAAVPAFAEEITLTNGEKTNLTVSSGTTGSGNTYSYTAPTETDKGGWLWLGNLQGTSSVAFGTSGSQMKLSGTGIIAVGYQGGNGGVVYNFDFSNTDASAFSGKFAVVNEWDNDTLVKLSGEGWSNVEYVSGGVSREQSWATLRSYANAGRAMDKLELQGATTLAGITGVSKGYSYGNVSDVNAKEFVTASTSGTVLTLAGTGTYSYYGSVGTSSVSIALEKTGTGTQTFGGAAKYLSSVNVSAGTLALTDGTVTISGDATVASGAALDLSGATVTLSKAVSNSGTVTVNSNTVFVLADALKSDEAYRLISGGTIDGWNNTTLSLSNFRKADGSAVSGRSTVDVSTVGVVKITEVLANLVWNGGESGSWDTTTQNWTNSATSSADVFYTGDNVTFSTSDASVSLGEAITAGTVTVSANTTITATETNTLTADSISVSAGTLTLAGQQYVSASSINIESGATLDLGSFDNNVNVVHKLTGTGTVSFSKTGSNHGHTINLGTEFAGTVNYSGTLNPKNATFGSSDATVNFTGVWFWSNGETGTIAQTLKFFGTGNRSNNGTLNLTGNISFDSGASFTVGGGTVNISGAVTDGNFTQTAGTMNISGTGTKKIQTLSVNGGTANITAGATEITTLSQTAGTLNFTGTGTTTVGSFTGPTASGGGTNPVTNVNEGATVDVTNDFVLRYEGNGTSTLNVAGTLSVGGALTLSRDGNGIANINNGGTLIAGSLGFGQNWSGSKSSVVNVKTGGTLIANGFTKAFNNINSSSFNLSGGTLGTSADSVTLNVGSLPVVLGDGTTSTINTGKYDATTKTFTETGSSITIANVISGTGALAKAGAGTLTLSGANTFTGGMTISAGTLIASNASALGTGNVTVASGAVLSTVSGTALAVGGAFTTTGAATLGLGEIGSAARIAATGAVTLSKDTIFDLSSIATGVLISGSSVTISDSGSFSGDNFRLNGGVLGDRTTVTVSSSDNALSISVSKTVLDLTWAGGATEGDTSNLWKANTTGWSADGQTNPQFQTGDNVTFGDTNAGAVNVSGVISIGTLTINSSADYTFSAVADSGAKISGAGTLTKSGTGTATFSGIDFSDYSGAIAISAGTLNLALESGTTLLSGVISGAAGTFEKSGAGTLVLTGTNTFTGKLLISGGLVELGSTSALGGSAVSVEVATGGTLDLKGKTKDGWYGNYILSGGTLINTDAAMGTGNRQLAGGITLNADSTIGGTHNFGMVSHGHNANTLTLNNHTLTKTGTNTFYLVNTTISAGTIDIQDGSITLYSGVASNGSAATFKIGNAGKLALDGTAFSVASITTEGDGAIDLGSGTLTLLGDSTIRRITSAGTVAVSEGKTLTLETGRFNAATFSVGTSAKIILAGDTDATVQNVISGAGSLEKTGAGTKTLSGTNTFTGGVTISAGTLIATQDAALGDATGAIAIEENGTLELGSGIEGTFSRTVSGKGTLVTNADLSWTAGTDFSGSFNVKSGTFTLTAGAGSSFKNLSASAGTTFKASQNIAFSTIAVEAEGTLSVASASTRVSVAEGSFAGTLNTVALVKTGTGTLDMNGATFATGGSLVVDGGTVSNLTLASGGRVEISGAQSGASGITFSNLVLAGGTIALSGLSADTASATFGFNTTLCTSVTIELRGLSINTTYKLFGFSSDDDKALISDLLDKSKLVSNLGALGKFTISDNYLCFTQEKSAGTLIWDSAGDGVWSNDEDTKSWLAGDEKSAFLSSAEVIFNERSLDERKEANVLIADDNELSAQSFTVDVGDDGKVILWNTKATQGFSTKFSVSEGIKIESGTLVLHLAEGDYTGAFSIGANTTLDVQRAETIGTLSDLTMANVISGAGTVVHAVDSKLTLSGDRSAFTGTLDVQAGTVALEGNASGEEKFSVVKIAEGATVSAKSGTAESISSTWGTINVSKLKIALSGAGTFSLSSALTLADKNFTTLDLGDDSDFAGTVVLNALDLAVGTYDNIEGTTSTVPASNFGTGDVSLQLKGGSSLNFFNDARTFAHDIDVAENGAIRVYGGNDGAEISGDISGAGTLTVKDGGKLILSGNVGTAENTLAGLTLDSGKLEITGDTMNIAGAVTLAGTAATLAATNGYIGGDLTATTTGTLTLGGTLNIAGNIVRGGGDWTESQNDREIAISDSAKITVAGGITFNNASKLTIGDNASMSVKTFTAAWGLVDPGFRATEIGLGIGEGSTLTVSGEMSLTSLEGTRGSIIAGTGTSAGTLALGSLTVGSGAEYLFRNLNIAITGNDESVGITNSGTIKLQNVVFSAAGETGWTSASNFALNNGTTTFNVDADKTITLSGLIAEAVAEATGTEGEADYVAATESALVKTGAGTLKLTQVNTNASGTTVSAGTLEYALSDGTAFAQNVTVEEAGALRFAASTTTGDTTTVGGTVNVGSELNFADGSTLTAATGTTINIAENGSLTGAITFSSEGTSGARGNLTFATDSTIAAGDSLTLNDGVVSIASDKTLTVAGTLTLSGTQSWTTVGGDGTLKLDGGTLATNTTMSGLTVSAAVEFAGNAVVNTEKGNLQLKGEISGAADAVLTKNGSGRLTFVEPIGNFAGSLVVNAGTVALSNNDVLENAKALTIASGATFSGNVTMASGGDVSIASGAQLSGNVTMTGGTFALESGTLTGNATFTNSTLTFGENVDSGAAKSSTIFGNFSVSGSTLTLRGDTVSTGYFDVGTGNTITLSEAFGKSISGTQTLIDFSSSNLASVDVTTYINFTSGTESYGRRRLGLVYNATNTSLDVASTGTLIWNKNVGSWGVSSSDLWTFEDETSTSGTTTFFKNDYVMFTEAGSVSLAETTINSSGVVFDLDGAFTIGLADGITSSILADADAGANAGLSIFSGDVTFAEGVRNTMTGGIYLAGGSLTVYSGNALGSADDSAAGLFLEGGTLNFVKNEEAETAEFTAGQNVTLGVVDAASTSTVDVAENVSVTFTKAFEKASETYDANLTKTGDGSLSISRRSEIDLLRVSAGTVTLTGDSTADKLGVKSVYVAGTLNLEECDYIGGNAAFTTVELSDGTFDLTNGGAFRAGTLYGKGTVDGTLAVGALTVNEDGTYTGTVVNTTGTLTLSGVRIYEGTVYTSAFVKTGTGTLKMGGTISASVRLDQGTIETASNMLGTLTAAGTGLVFRNTGSANSSNAIFGGVNLADGAGITFVNSNAKATMGITGVSADGNASTTLTTGNFEIAGTSANFGSGASSSLTISAGTNVTVSAETFTAGVLSLNNKSNFVLGSNNTSATVSAITVAATAITGATIDLSSGKTLTVEGVNGVAVLGTGKLTVKGVSGDDLDAGKLVVNGHDGYVSTGGMDIVLSNATLAFDVGDGTSSWASISSITTANKTSGVVEKSGAGTLSIASEEDTLAFDGTISVSEGTLRIGSRMTKADVDIADGATLTFFGSAATAVSGKVGSTTFNAPLANALTGEGTLLIAGSLLTNRDGENSGLEDFNGTIAADGSEGVGYIFSGAALADWEANNSSRDVELRDGGTLVFGGSDETTANTLNHLSVNGSGTLVGNARTLNDGTVVVDTFTKIDATTAGSSLLLEGKGIISGMTFADETDDDGERVAGSVFLSSGAEWTFAGTNTGLIDINILESSLIVTSAGALAEEGTSIVVRSSSLTFAGVSATFANSAIGLLGTSDAHSEIIATDGANVALTGTLGDEGYFADFTATNASTLTLTESALSFVSTFTVEDAESKISVGVDSAQTLEADTRVLSGAGTFEKTGAGTLSVSGDAGTIGALAVSAGTVSFGENSKIAADADGAGTLSVADGATLNLAAGTDLSGFTLSGVGAVAISAESSNSAKLAGMDGATDVSLMAGTLQVGGNVADSTITFVSGTALETTGDSVVSDTTLSGTSLKLINSGTAEYADSVTLDGATSLELQAAKDTAGTFAADYSGNLTKTGDGTWTVSNYSFGASDGQALTVSAGTLIWESANFGDKASTLTVDGVLQIASLESGNELNTTIHGSGILKLADCGTSDEPFVMNATAADGATWALHLSGTSYVEMANALPGELFIMDKATGVLDVDSDVEMGAGKRVYVMKEATLVKTGTGTLTLSEVEEKHSFGTLDIQEGKVVQAGNIVWDGSTLNIASGATFEVDATSFNTNRATLTGAGTFKLANTDGKEYELGGKLNDFTGTVNIGSGTTLALTSETLENATETAVAGTLRIAISGKTARTLNNLSGEGTLIIDAPQKESTIPYAVHNWGDGNTDFTGKLQVKSGILSLSADKLGEMTADVTIGGTNAAKYSEKEESSVSGILQGGFLRVTSGSSDEIDVADKIFGNDKYSFTSKGGLLLSGGTFGINADSGTAGLFVTESGANLHLRNGADINGSVFVARGAEMFVGETSTTSGDAGTVPTSAAGTLATSGNSSISGDFTLNGTLTIYVSDASLSAGTPLLGVGGSVALDADSGTPATISLELTDTSVSLDSVAVTILGGTFSGDASALSDLVTVTDSTGTAWAVRRDTNGHLVLANLATEYKNPPKGLRELYDVVKDTALGNFIQSDLGKSEERLVALSPVSFGALIEMQSGFASLENDLLRERLEQRRYERAIVGDSRVSFKPFVNVFGSDRESDGNGTDSANYDMTHAGVFGGFDTAISSNTIVGVSVGLDWAKARLHDGAGKHTGDGSRLGVYGMSQFENAYVGYGLSAGGMNFETKRNTGYNNESVTGETDGNDVNASFLFGAGWTVGGGVDFAPFVGVDIGYARVKSFSEKDGNATALDVEKTERWSVRGKIGAALNWRATESLRFGLEASFAHEFLDTEADIDATFASGSAAGTKFTSTAYLMDENTIQIGPRVDFRIDETWSLSAAYTFETDLEDTTTHSANVGLRARF